MCAGRCREAAAQPVVRCSSLLSNTASSSEQSAPRLTYVAVSALCDSGGDATTCHCHATAVSQPMRQIKQTRDGHAPGWTLFQDLPKEPPLGDYEKLDRALDLLKVQAHNSTQGTASDNLVPGGLFDQALAPPIPEDLSHTLRLSQDMVEHEAVT